MGLQESARVLSVMCAWAVACLACSAQPNDDMSQQADAFDSPELLGPDIAPRNTVLHHGIATLKGIGADSERTLGDVVFHDFGDGMGISLELSGLLPDGVHGMSIRSVETCSVQNLAQQPHFNPFGAPHGPVASLDHHLGDLGNAFVDEAGNALMGERALPFGDIFITHIGPVQVGEGGAFDVKGLAVVLQAGPDDPEHQNPDNTGGVIACGIITERE